MQKQLLFLIFLFSISNNIFSQELESNFKKNLISISASTAPDIYSIITVDFERNFINYDWYKLNLQTSIGRSLRKNQTSQVLYNDGSPVYNNINISINSLFGRKSHHFELDFGVSYFSPTNVFEHLNNGYHPIINIGYRYQNPFGKGLVFKSFIGSYGLGISIGKAF